MHKLLSVGLLALAVSLAGCNTLRGIGQDIEKAGAAIEKSAR